MSKQLAISSALSVLLMAGYVLLGGDARQADFAASQRLVPQVAAAATSLLPQASAELAR